MYFQPPPPPPPHTHTHTHTKFGGNVLHGHIHNPQAANSVAPFVLWLRLAGDDTQVYMFRKGSVHLW